MKILYGVSSGVYYMSLNCKLTKQQQLSTKIRIYDYISIYYTPYTFYQTFYKVSTNSLQTFY